MRFFFIKRKFYLTSTSAPDSFNLAAIFRLLHLFANRLPLIGFLERHQLNLLASFKPKPVQVFYYFNYLKFCLDLQLLKTTSNVGFFLLPPEQQQRHHLRQKAATAAAAGSIPYSSFKIFANSLTSFTVKINQLFCE